ncbi:MAG TPA: nucleotidyl transferase AbiEii/AbiGii toxin family protein [Candidatus Dojkabacteria bacterium]|nr:nucleotidyl transferase AbiEii/AbiGii toxin family protein [Candidatus Dojkabacteria bacterium]
MHTLTKSLQELVTEGREKGYEDSKIGVILKEYIQDIVLYIVYNNPQTSTLIFYGGSSLRKIYGLDRFSEDLDFENPEGIDLIIIPEIIQKYFKGIGMTGVECKAQESKNITRITVKFPIAQEIGLSTHSNEKLHVKVEVNNDLIGSYPTELTSKMLRRYSVILRHYDISTLFACKIVACLDRVYVKGNKEVNIKGRDFYDLIWFINNTNILPNEKKLLDVNKEYTVGNVFNLLDKKIAEIKSSDLLDDLRNLLEDGEYIIKWCNNFQEIYSSSKQRYFDRVVLTNL